MGHIWDRFKSWLNADKFPVEPWAGGSVFDAKLLESDASGVELLNDEVTPMEYVVSVLSRCLGLSRKDATEGMLRIHFKGSARFGRMNHSVASELVEHIRAEATKVGYPLICRVCEAQPTLVPEPIKKDDIV